MVNYSIGVAALLLVVEANEKDERRPPLAGRRHAGGKRPRHRNLPMAVEGGDTDHPTYYPTQRDEPEGIEKIYVDWTEPGWKKPVLCEKKVRAGGTRPIFDFAHLLPCT